MHTPISTKRLANEFAKLSQHLLRGICAVSRKGTLGLLTLLFCLQPLGPVFAADAVPVTDATPPMESPAEAVPLDTPIAADASPVLQAPLDTGTAFPALTAVGADSSALLSDGTLTGTGVPNGTAVGTSPTTLTGSNPFPADPTNPLAANSSKQVMPETDPSTGALVYNYPIEVPPGRNGLQPDLSLSYNSQAVQDGSFFGAGWGVNIPSIQRINRHGFNLMYSEQLFTSSVSGELVNVSSGVFADKVENGDFLNYAFSNNVWTVKDKRGTTFTYGSSTASRQDNPNDGTKIFKWMLQEVRDANGNYMTYEYVKDQGQIYPSKIKYTGNGSVDGIFDVTFLRQSRTDAVKSYGAGFLAVTAYRVNEIDTNVSATVSRKYALAYATGGNGVRSLLSSVTETGYATGGTPSALPAVTFQYQQGLKTWSSDAGWTAPIGVNDLGTYPVDVNGDGLTDIIQSYSWVSGSNQGTVRHTYLNNGNRTFTENSAYVAPVNFASPNSDGITTIDARTIPVDINGDGLTDIISSAASSSYLNNGNGWTAAGQWTFPIPVGCDVNGGGGGAQLGDLNGDGLPDLISNQSVWNGTSYDIVTTVYLNTGSGWTLDSGWNLSILFGSTGNAMPDVNGDGLADVFISYRQTNGNGNPVTVQHTYVNTGNKTFVEDTNYTPPVVFDDVTYSSGANYTDYNYRFADGNGDGTQDIINYATNTAIGWSTTGAMYTPCSFWSASGSLYICHLADMNGDGLQDLISGDTYWNGSAYVVETSVWTNNGPKDDLLKKITFSRGGFSSITYKASPLYRDAQSSLLSPHLPFATDTVNTIATDDAFGTAATTTYSFEGGLYHYASIDDRRFAGFAKVKSNDTAGNVTTTFYHQGDTSDSSHGEYSDSIAKVGKPYRVENADSSGNLYAKTINKWDSYDLGGGRTFVKLAQTVRSVFDGDTTHKDSAGSYTYSNANGNISEKIQWGDVTGADDGTFTDAGSDKFTTDMSYATDGAYVVGLPSQSTVTDQSSVKVKESKYYYDSQSLGAATKGNLTRQEDWKTGTSYVATQKSYDGTYGIVASDTDARGKVTSYSYDSYHLYPTTVTNPLSQATSYTYDYTSGKVEQTTDPNARVFQNIYDGLDRPLQVKQPDITTPSTLVVKTQYTYTDTAGATSVKKSENLDASIAADTYTYLDGLGRPLQERQDAEGSNFSVNDYAYNTLGLTLKESLPYFSSGTSRTTATSDSTLYATYAYDPMRRVSTSTTALGTTTNTYSDRKLTVTDANGKAKDFVRDAYGNLVEVDEHNSGSTYVTSYLYDYLGDLTRITDASSNVRNFTYDGLGRRLTAEDLHATGDSTFGSWSYTYDDAGNLTSKADPKSQTVNYTYDDVNRPLTEDYTGQTGTEVTNTYDSGTDGIGRLTNTVNSAVNKALTYNALGLEASETSTINSTNYTTSYGYDRQSNQILTTNPDSSQVQNVYNSAGLLDKTQRKESTDGAFTDVVSNFDYSPTGQVATALYANGQVTTNTLDAAKRYRLAHKVTTVPVYGGGGTVTFYPSVGDGLVFKKNASGSWSGAHDATTGDSTSYTGTTFTVSSGYSGTNIFKIDRAFLPFDTSSLPDNATITDAQLKIYVDGKSDNDNDGDDWVTVVQTTQSSTSTLSTTDYNKDGSVSNPTEGVDAAGRQDITGVATGQYLTYALNSVGRSWVSKTGFTKLGLREGHDAISSAFTGSSGQSDQLLVRAAEYAGTSSDPYLQVTYTTPPPPPNTVMQDIAYSYDNVGNVTRVIDASGTSSAKTVNYTYDDLYRMLTATATSVASGQSTYTQTYAYDAIGNITSGPSGTYIYAGNIGSSYANPHAVTSIGGTTLTYDNDGSELTKGSALANTWDYNNRLTQAVAGSVTSAYAYDPSGERIKTSDGTTTTYLPTTAYNIAGSTQTKHITANGISIATITGTGATAVVSYVHADHLTGANVVTDTAGAQKELLDYFPYGAIRIDQKAGSFSEQRKYAGHEFDVATSLSYMGARYYDASIGRFLSDDPVFLALGDTKTIEQKTKMKQEDLLSNPQLLNSYSYVANNPLKHIDESGEFLHLVVGAGVAVVGQYAVDVTRNITNSGLHVSSFTSNLSSGSEYLMRAGQGALIAGTGGLAVAAEAGAVGIGLTTGATAMFTSPVIDAAQGRPVDVQGAVSDGLVTGVTSGVVRSFPGIPGRLPNFGTKAFFAGAHTVRDAITVGLEVAAGSAAVNVTAIFNSFFQRDNIYGDAPKNDDSKK